MIITTKADTSSMDYKTFSSYSLNTLKSGFRDMTKLKNAILKSGFNFPVFVWEEGKYIIDGSGRAQALTELIQEGHSIKSVPYVNIQAGSIEEAREMTLQASSQYGETSVESLKNFIGEQNLDWDTFDIGISEIDFNIVKEDTYTLERNITRGDQHLVEIAFANRENKSLFIELLGQNTMGLSGDYILTKLGCTLSSSEDTEEYEED